MSEFTEQAKRALLDRINSGDGGRRDLPRVLRAIDRAAIDQENRTVSLSFSSETPVERWWGVEILDHRAKSVDLSKMKAGRFGPLLENHDPYIQLGVVESAEIDETRKKGTAVVRFGTASPAQEIAWADVANGIRGNISVGYEILDLVLEEEKKDSPPVYRVTKWRPFEVSLVSIPADTRVGVGRSVVTVPTAPVNTRKEVHMDPENPTQTGAAVVNAPSPPTTTPPPDVRGIESDGRRAERERAREILAIGDHAKDKGGQELARQFVDNGGSVDQFRAALFARMYGNDGRAPVTDAAVGMSTRELKRYSLFRIVNALSNPTNAQLQAAAAFEFECSAAALKAEGRSLRAGAQVTIPTDVMQSLMRRDLLVTYGTATSGGAMVATDVLGGSFIEVLRVKSRVIGLGATVLQGLQGNVAIPRMTGASTGYWVSDGTAPTESTPTLDQVTLYPRTVGSFVDVSRKTIMQPSVDVENLIRGDLAKVIAIAIDNAAIQGNGTAPTPSGILTSTSIGSTTGGAQGAIPTWANIVALESSIATNNADDGSLGYLTTPGMRGALKGVLKTTAGIGFVWGEGDSPVNGYKAMTSNNVPSTGTKGTTTGMHSIIFGDWNSLLIGMWSGIDINVDPYSLSSMGALRIVALQDLDIAMRHPESFAAMKDGKTA